ncbi:MAG: clostripain-related cysteine peptidase [Candidatus Thermoplasmatota archaeon]
MMKRQILILAVLSLIIIIFTPTLYSQHPTLRKWTLLIYLDADNNLEEAGIEDINELEMVGSTNDVNVIVQIDRIDEYDTSNGDWKGAKRYYVTKDEDTAIINSVELEDLGEINMGGPTTLIDFVLFGIENYPAEHYLLDFWDHGGSWQGVCWDDTNQGDYLTLSEIEFALSAIRNKSQKNIDIALFDACTMGNTEVFYQLRNYVDIAVGSEASVPGDGCPYNKILEFITSTPSATKEELATKIVELYIESYSDGESDPDDTPSVTMSAFKLKNFDVLAEHVDELCMMLSKKSGLPLQNLQIVNSRMNSQQFLVAFVPSPFPNILSSMIDLYDFCYELTRQPTIDTSIKSKARDVMKYFEELKVAEAHNDLSYGGAHGLTIYFPNEISTEYRSTYDKIAFAEDKYWNEFIHHVNRVESAKDTPPTCLISEPQQWEIITSEYYQVKGSAFDVESLQQVQIKIDDGEWLAVEGTKEWSYNWQTSSGKHTICARSFDSSRQYSTEFKIGVEVVKGVRAGAPLPWLGIGVGIVIAIVTLALLPAIIKRIRATKK